jgi:Spy/CpxP family protein refolding chaperone
MTQSLVVLAIMMVSVTAFAQMGKGGKGQSGMMGEGMMGGMMSGGMGMGMHGPGMEMGGMGEMMKMMGAAAKLDLTAEQQKKLRLATLQHQKEAIPLLGQLRMAGVEIQELLLADPVNLDKIKAKVKEKYDAAAKLEMSHLALTQEVKKMLTSEQRQQMGSLMMQMGPMMGAMPMMESMMGSSSGQAKGEGEPKEAPNGTSEGAPESKDPHGH